MVYFAGYRRAADRYRVDDIEAASDVVVWCCDEAPGFTPRRPQDRAFVGNIVEAMHAYASGALGKAGLHLWDAEESGQILGIPFSVSDDGSDFTFGLGIQASLSKQFSVRFEFDSYDLDDSDVQFLGISAILHF